MTQDTKDVQPEDVSQETESTQEETSTQSSDEDKIAQMVEAAVNKAVGTATESARREIQSVKDKARREVEDALGRATYAEGTVTNIKSDLKDLEPDVANSIELAESKNKLKYYQGREAREAQKRQQEAYTQQLKDSLAKHLENLGIDPKDERIDWAQDEPDYIAGRGKFDTSVTKILKGNQKAEKEKMTGEFKELESNLRRELGLDSTPTIPGGTSKGIPTDMGKFREWVDSLSQEEYKEKQKDIDEMLQKGLIK